MARASHPKSARLRLRSEYRRALRRGRLHAGRECVVRVAPGSGETARLGLAVPVRYGGAVRRNRFRRLAREAFRALRPELRLVDLVVAPRRGLREPSLAGLRADLRTAAREATPRAGRTR
jgi:ribonuclease P protein component